ncbi:hypothetical protein SAMN05444143_104159 [Flavobacterium succinicans]|uniref:Uncharacterized protein n=1 Tax=Flavobacterium succinicans TaxID=29536 RepID=A0A1I4V7B5_9FLAO|nr:hypothetical protein [Flavobacterium succinicans]SFM97061.1 hypothetical protein SAMN05444143_104159 [Flavobacterium succinicans]
MNKQEEKLNHLHVGLNEIDNSNQVNSINILNDEFENQKRAYDNYLKLFNPELLRTKTIYKDLYNILDRDLNLTKVSLGDYFLEQFVTEINKSLDRIENEVNYYAQNNNYDKTQNEQLIYHKSYLVNCINKLVLENSITNRTPASNINDHSAIFSNNGFELFNYILENHIKPKGKRGRYADLSFYYWCLFNAEEKYIHQRPEVFKTWFCKEYTDSFEKIKTMNEVNDKDGNRKKHYQTSLDWLKGQT